ncbi:hypothetical protein P3T37_006963 [Kitasatospora sp. MAA4]|uniref:substrate-binding domain-containing protein n=1 Tax=Kitasatospora sp. MAA4 TaxID=3035093 RepID=UPI002475B450|nr:substrate-binding domain-containing protein [Kitasatospora sp. MAA4]MDH6137530.1 hypothetical protein [Kitasatospora sp. MAA4]
MPRTVTGLLATAATLAIAASLTTAAAGPAAADPAVMPAAQDIVGAGDQASQGLLNQFSTDYNAALTATGDTDTPRLYSWDATPTFHISLKDGAPRLTRPYNSDIAIHDLGLVDSSTFDFARSSRGPEEGDDTTDAFVGYAEDAVTWAAPAGGDAPANLTSRDLTAIYTCSITNWNQITDVPGYHGPNATIRPFLPNGNSDTGESFLRSLGGSLGPVTPGACLQPELQSWDTGIDPLLADPDALVPYSAGHYIGQVYGGHTTATDAPGNLTLRAIDGVGPLAADHTLAPAFTSSGYGRELYNVIRGADWTGTDDHAGELQDIFGSDGWVCTDPVAQADLAGYGFQSLPDGVCGTAVHPVPTQPAVHAGMTWTVRAQQPDGEVHVGYDATTNAYNGDTPATAVLPLLCLTITGAGAPADLTPDFYDGWSRGTVALSAPVAGSALHSRADADALCAGQFGPGYREAEFHDGYVGSNPGSQGGWSFWANGTIATSTRFWVAINDQQANPWSE